MAPSSTLSLAGVVALALAVGLGSCRSTRRTVPAEWPPLEAAELGSMRSVSFSQGLWFGSEPTVEDLELAYRRGVERVIDVCVDEHEDLTETCLRLGVEYLRVRIDPSEEPPPGAVDLLLKFLDQEDRPDTLMYCEEGTTCAALFAILRVTRHGVPLGDALSEARRVGLRTDPGESWVRAHVARLDGSKAP